MPMTDAERDLLLTVARVLRNQAFDRARRGELVTLGDQRDLRRLEAALVAVLTEARLISTNDTAG